MEHRFGDSKKDAAGDDYRLCPRTGYDIMLNRRYLNNDRMIQYRRLPTNIFMDTMFASRRVGKSYRGYTCVQVYATEFGWLRAD